MQRHLSDYPQLGEQFHPAKKGDLKLENYTHKSGKKYVGNVKRLMNVSGKQEMRIEVMVMVLLFALVNERQSPNHECSCR